MSRPVVDSSCVPLSQSVRKPVASVAPSQAISIVYSVLAARMVVPVAFSEVDRSVFAEEKRPSFCAEVTYKSMVESGVTLRLRIKRIDELLSRLKVAGVRNLKRKRPWSLAGRLASVVSIA